MVKHLTGSSEKRQLTVHDILTHTSGFFFGVYKLGCAFGSVPQLICEMWAEAQIKKLEPATA